MKNYLIVSNFGYGEKEVYGMVKIPNNIDINDLHKESRERWEELWPQLCNGKSYFFEFLTKIKGFKELKYEEFCV